MILCPRKVGKKMNKDLEILMEIVGEKQYAKIKADVVKFLGIDEVATDMKVSEFTNQKSLTSVFYAIAFKYCKNEEDKTKMLTKIFVNSK